MAKTPEHERLMNVEFMDAALIVDIKLDVFDNAKLQKARELRRIGAPAEGYEVLTSDPHWDVTPEALNEAALLQIALGNYAHGLEFLEASEKRLYQKIQGVLINRSSIQVLIGDYAGAEEAARAALEIAPDNHAGWVNILALQSDHWERIGAIVEEMSSRWPKWRRDPKLRRHLLEDVTLAHVRAHPDFQRLFGPLFEEER